MNVVRNATFQQFCNKLKVLHIKGEKTHLLLSITCLHTTKFLPRKKEFSIYLGHVLIVLPDRTRFPLIRVSNGYSLYFFLFVREMRSPSRSMAFITSQPLGRHNFRWVTKVRLTSPGKIFFLYLQKNYSVNDCFLCLSVCIALCLSLCLWLCLSDALFSLSDLLTIPPSIRLRAPLLC